MSKGQELGQIEVKSFTSQTQADGTTYQFSYTIGGGGPVVQTDVTDPRGLVRRVTFDSSGYPLTRTPGPSVAPSSRPITQSACVPQSLKASKYSH